MNMNRAGAGYAYIPRMALNDLLDDELTAFSSDNTDTSIDPTDLTGTVGLPDVTDLSTSIDTYDPTTGQDITPTGVAATGIAGAGLLSSIASGFSSLFNGGTSAQVNATGISGDEETSTLVPMLLLIAGAAGVLYMVSRDRS